MSKDKVDTRPDIGVSLSPRDREALAREAQFKQRTCSSAITRRPKHGSINDDGSDIREPKTDETLRPQGTSVGQQIEEGYDAKEALDEMQAEGFVKPAPVPFNPAEPSVTVWDSDSEGQQGAVVPEDDGKNYDPFFTEQSVRAAGVNALRDRSLMVDSQTTMQEIFDYTTTRADQG